MLNKLKNLFFIFKENVFEKYPVTMWSIWIASVFTAIVCDEQNDEGTIMRWLIKLTFFLWSFAVGAFYNEECLKKNESVDNIHDFWHDNGRLVLGFVVAAVAAAGVVYFGFYEGETLFGVERDLALEYIGKFYLCFYAWVFILTVYHIFRSGAESFEKFAINVVGNSVKTSVVYGLFALGVLFLVLIIEALLFDTGSFLKRIELFLAGAIYVPGMILAVSRIKDLPGKFFSGVVKFVLLPLTLAAFVIIYVYILKIIVSWSLPSNEVFGILTALFVCGLPIWTMASYYKDSKLGKIAEYMPYAFVPFIILQIICIGLRIGQYGLTDERYMACMLIAFEILYIVIYSICQRKYLSWVMMVLTGLLTVYLLVPLVNCDRMVFQSQKKRVEKYIRLSDTERGKLTNEEKKALCGAYRALSYTRLGEQYIDNMQQNDIRWIEECGENVGDYYVNSSKLIYAHHDLKSWNLEGYSCMYEVSGIWDEEENTDKFDANSFIITITENKDTKLAVDLTGFIKEIEEEYDRSNNDNLNEWLAGHNEIVYSDSKLIIEYVRADLDGDNISELYISGYYLK